MEECKVIKHIICFRRVPQFCVFMPYLLSFNVRLAFSMYAGESGEKVYIVTLTEGDSCFSILQGLHTDNRQQRVLYHQSGSHTI